MSRRRHTPEQVVRKLREADRLLGEGFELPDVIKHLEVSEQTYFRWRNQFGGMKADDVKRLKKLEAENVMVSQSGSGANSQGCPSQPAAGQSVTGCYPTDPTIPTYDDVVAVSLCAQAPKPSVKAASSVIAIMRVIYFPSFLMQVAGAHLLSTARV